MEIMDEKEIVLRAKKDASAFEYIYEKYFPMIFKYVIIRVNNRDDAEEIVSTVFYKALNKIGSFRWQSVPFSAWLYRIAVSEIGNHYRLHKKSFVIGNRLQIENEIPVDEPEDDNFSYDFIHQYIQQLPQKDQDIITLRYFEKKSFSEISDILNKKETTLRVNLHRALNKLESLIPKEVLADVYRKVS
ncbi:MAG: sigma-70 family RNA polymerase sigma factor [Candidatus Cloacimonetes bacterium]|nr:sigma-70 family RNA polymerase sigma factor [Candidatus Cloacimonadota bacterium]